MAKVLVVDDEPMILDLVRRALGSAGHEVRLADGGDAALAALADERFDMVVTDILMPGKEGIALILDIRRLRPGLPVIAISGGHAHGSHDVLDVARRLGAVHTLAKPFRARTLVTLVETCLRDG